MSRQKIVGDVCGAFVLLAAVIGLLMGLGCFYDGFIHHDAFELEPAFQTPVGQAVKVGANRICACLLITGNLVLLLLLARGKTPAK